MAHVQKKTYRSARTGKLSTAWQARYMAPDGRERTKRFDRKVDAEKWLDVNGADVARGQWIDPDAGKITFKDYAAAWTAAQIHRPTTAALVASHLKNHIEPTFGARAISSIRPSEIQGWVRGRSDDLAPATVEVAFRYLSAIFKAAVRDRVIAFNPCEGVRLVRPERKQVDPLETDQVLALIDSMAIEWRPVAVLAAGAGLRQGEALGVTVDRVDFPRRLLTVDRQMVTVTGRAPFHAPPKTPSSVRTVPLPDFVTSALASHMTRAGLKVTDDGSLLFVTSDGKPIPRNRFAEAWQSAVKKSKIERPARFHDLRHYYASLLIRHGESIKVVQARLGHASAAETLDTYAHLWPDSEDRTRSAVDSVLTDKGRTESPEKAL